MNKLFRISLISIVLMFSTQPLNAFSRTYCADEIKYNISKSLTESYKQMFKDDTQEESVVLNLPFQKLEIPKGIVKFDVASLNPKFLPRDVKRVSILVNGKEYKTFNVPVENKVYKDVLVASTNIDRDQVLTPEIVTTKREEVSGMYDYIMTNDMMTKDIMVKKNFKDGEVIDKRFVKLRPDVMKNNLVTAFFKANDLTVSIEGVAMSNGMKGNYIGVQSKTYGKVYTAKIIGENKVLIQL